MSSRWQEVLVSGCILLALVAMSSSLSGCNTKKPTISEQNTDTVSKSNAIPVSPNDRRNYQLLTLDNGLEVMLVSDPDVEKSAAALSVGVGLLFDPMDYQGMAHYLEHMLFLGTEKYPEPDEYMSFINENGGARNAYTWLDITNYQFEVKNSAYDGALDRFSQFFKGPLLDPEYIEKEKSAVNAEWSMRREMDFFGMFRLGRLLLGNHPANRFLIGNLESLADKEGGSLHAATVDFYQQYYSANLMKVAMVSNLPIADMASLATRYFADIPNKNVSDPVVTESVDFATSAGKLVHFVPQEEQRMLQLEFLIDNNLDQFATKPSEYLAYILGSEMPDTPAVRLKELGWASALNVAASPNEYGNYGTFRLMVDLTEEGMAHRETITNMLLGYIEQIRAQGVDDRYAAEFKTSLDNRFRFLEKIGDFSYATQLAAAMQDFPSRHAVNAAYVFDGFDADEVNNVLAQLVPERLRVWYVSKDEPVEETITYYAGKYAVTDLQLQDVDKQLALAEQYDLALPALNSLLPESFEVAHASSSPVHAVLKDGIDIWLQGSEIYREQPKGFTQIYLNTPSRQQGPEALVLMALWDDLYSMTQRTLFTEASIAGMSAAMSTANGVKLTFSGFTDKQPLLIEQALDALRIQPSDEALAQAVDRFVRGIRNSKRSFPFRQLGPALRKLTTSGSYSDETLIGIAQQVTNASLTQFIDGELSTALARVYMFGNYSQNDADTLASLIEAKLPQRDASEYVRSAVYAPQPGEALVYLEDLPVEDLGMMYLFAAPEASFEAQAKADVVAAHLSNRAFNQLRTEEQLGYAAGGFASRLNDHPFIGFYIQTPVKAPADMLARFDTYTEEFRQDLEDLSEEDFERIKAGILTDLNKPPKNLSEEAGPFVSDWDRERYTFDSKPRLVAAVEDVTLEGIRDFYRETVLSPEKSRILIQMRGKAFADAPFAVIEDAAIIDDVAAFHQRMPKQP